MSSLGHSSNGHAVISAGPMTCKAQHRNNLCLRKRVSNGLIQSQALTQKAPKNIFKVTKKLMVSTNSEMSDRRYSLTSQQKSQSALKRTNSTTCDLSLRSTSNSRNSVVLPQIQYTQQIKRTTPLHSRPAPEPRTQASRQLFSTIARNGKLVLIDKPQTAARDRSGKKGNGQRAAILFSEGRRKAAASQERSNSCMSDGSYRETP